MSLTPPFFSVFEDTYQYKNRLVSSIMPRKKSDSSNEKLWFTLPQGAGELLDQLVELQEVGGSHSEVVRYLVQTQLQEYLDKNRISRPKRRRRQSGS